MTFTLLTNDEGGGGNTGFFGEKPAAFPELGFHPIEIPFSKNLLTTQEPGPVLGKVLLYGHKAYFVP